MRRRLRECAVVAVLLATGTLILAQGAPVRYVYDALGRLVGVIDVNGDAATYQ